MHASRPASGSCLATFAEVAAFLASSVGPGHAIHSTGREYDGTRGVPFDHGVSKVGRAVTLAVVVLYATLLVLFYLARGVTCWVPRCWCRPRGVAWYHPAV